MAYKDVYQMSDSEVGFIIPALHYDEMDDRFLHINL